MPGTIASANISAVPVSMPQILIPKPYLCQAHAGYDIDSFSIFSILKKIFFYLKKNQNFLFFSLYILIIIIIFLDPLWC